MRRSGSAPKLPFYSTNQSGSDERSERRTSNAVLQCSVHARLASVLFGLRFQMFQEAVGHLIGVDQSATSRAISCVTHAFADLSITITFTEWTTNWLMQAKPSVQVLVCGVCPVIFSSTCASGTYLGIPADTQWTGARVYQSEECSFWECSGKSPLSFPHHCHPNLKTWFSFQT